MAAGEDQPEPFVRNAAVLSAAVVSAWLRVARSRLPGCHHGQLLDLGPVGAAAPQAVGGPLAGPRPQPPPPRGPARPPLARPPPPWGKQPWPHSPPRPPPPPPGSRPP